MSLRVLQRSVSYRPNVGGRERATTSHDSEARVVLQEITLPQEQFKIFVGEKGVITSLEDHPNTPYVTILEDIPEPGEDHCEQLSLYFEEGGSEGLQFSITSGEPYRDIQGPHLWVDEFVTDYRRQPRVVDSDNQRFEARLLPLSNDVAYLGGIVDSEIRSIYPDAQEATPFIIQVRGKTTTIQLWNEDDKCWVTLERPNLSTILINKVKTIACIDESHLPNAIEVIASPQTTLADEFFDKTTSTSKTRFARRLLSTEGVVIDPGLNSETTNSSEVLIKARELLKTQFDQFDEIWIVGHKGDQALNLQMAGVVKDQIDVAHVHSTLGVNAKRIVKPPEGSAGSYESLLTRANNELEEEIKRVIESDLKVAVLMPFPNSEFEIMVHNSGNTELFTFTAPIPDAARYFQIEHKINFAKLLEDVFSGTQYESNLIPWALHILGETLEDSRRNLNTDGRLYYQKALSGGGDGTKVIDTEKQLSELMQIPEWATRPVKVSKEIENAYPANGTGCIIPTEDGDCIVLVDPLSHKPVGLPELNAKEGSGVGNDWSHIYPPEIQEQYIGMVTALGKSLYKEFGITGVFGPDGLVADGKYMMTEVNPRWQGTTPYQTQNALKNGRLPLEYIHYMVKLASNDPKMLRKIHSMIGHPSEYNISSVNERGGFYIKVGGPTSPRVVMDGLNGPWMWNGETLTRSKNHKLSPMDVYTGALETDDEGVEHHVVWIKAPLKGDMVGGELAPIAYIVGSGFSVFSEDQPGITEDAQKMYDNINILMFDNT